MRPSTIVLLLCPAAITADAQTTRGNAETRHTAVPSVTALSTADHFHVDGKLDEDDWSKATPATRFTQTEPGEGQPATEQTEVRIIRTANAVYVGAWLRDSEPRRIDRRLTRRDDAVASDYFAVSLDSYHDHRTGVRFQVSPSGAFNDATISGPGNADDSWDPVWAVATSIDSSGWSVEMRIPLSQLRYDSHGDPSWGIQLERFILRKQEHDWFVFVPRSDRSGAERYGHLNGMDALPPPDRLELIPFVSTKGTALSEFDRSPIAPSGRVEVRAGMDASFRLSGNFVAAATINPDFGQVEVDPAVVNLTAFETVFPEKRPFFVQGSNAFSFGRLRAYNFAISPSIFFARRIGRSPQLHPRDAVFLDAPQQTDIRSAVKLTGQTASGWSLGLLHAYAAEESARFSTGSVDSIGRAVIEPATQYAVARTSRSLRNGATTVGGILTGVLRSTSDSSADAQLRSRAAVGGLDLNHSWNHHSWAFDASLSGSQVHGTRSAMTATQRASTRYYQRPDAKEFALDTSRTSLEGYAGQAALTKLRGTHWVGSLAYQETSPGYETNDIGLERSAGRRAFSTDLHYQENASSGIFRNYIIWPFTNHQWNFDGDRLQNHSLGTYNFWFQGQLRNFTQVVAWLAYEPSALDDQLTRGGPTTAIPARRLYYAQANTDNRHTLSLGGIASTSRTAAGEYDNIFSVTSTWRPRSNVTLRVDPGVSRSYSLSQFITRRADPLAVATYGQRDVFATLRQRTASVDIRGDLIFTPRLSLQVYTQPLIVSGAYSELKELDAARTYRFAVYGQDRGAISTVQNGFTVDPDGSGASPSFFVARPDFTFRSLRANAVLRWEYRPGSTFFAVWQRSASDIDDAGNFRLSRDISALAKRKGSNVFLLKATYWFVR